MVYCKRYASQLACHSFSCSVTNETRQQNTSLQHIPNHTLLNEFTQPVSS